MIDKSHEHCATCDWLGREAERTARELGRCAWASETRIEDGVTHVAVYEQSETTTTTSIEGRRS